MSLRYRTFLIADDGTLYRLANARFDRMLRDPASYRLPALAGQRVRMANTFVEVVDRVPVCVVRSTFAMLTIDDLGPHQFKYYCQLRLLDDSDCISVWHP